MEFLWFILVGLIAGVLAGTIVKGGGYGIVGDMIVGVLGAILGGFLFSQFSMPVGTGLLASILVATVGAVLLILILRAVKRV